jgi:hypothetical protein
MANFDVTIKYERKDRSVHSRTFAVRDVSDQAAAADVALDRFRQGFRHRNSAVLDAIVRPWGPPNTPPRVTPVETVETVETGETVTVEVTGKVEVCNDKVLLRTKAGQLIAFGKRYIEQQLGRPVGPVVTTEFWSVYPNGNVYKGDRVIRNSSYDLNDIVQIRVTKHDGKIVNKEFV